MRPALGKSFTTRLSVQDGDLGIVVDPTMRLLDHHEMATLRRLANAAIAATQDDAARFELEGHRFTVEWDDTRGNQPMLILAQECREHDAEVARQALAEGPVPDLVKIMETALFLLKRRASYAAARNREDVAPGLSVPALGMLLYLADLQHLSSRPVPHNGDRTQIGHDRHKATACGPLGANLEAMVSGHPTMLTAMGLGASPFRLRDGVVEGRRDPRMGVFTDSEALVLDNLADSFIQMDEDDVREVGMRGLVAWKQARRDARLPDRIDGGANHHQTVDAVHQAPSIDILVDAARWTGEDDESITYARERSARARFDR